MKSEEYRHSSGKVVFLFWPARWSLPVWGVWRITTVATAPGGLGKGVFYWEPAWLGLRGCGWDSTDATSGNAWENQALFGFDGRALPALAVFREFSTE